MEREPGDSPVDRAVANWQSEHVPVGERYVRVKPTGDVQHHRGKIDANDPATASREVGRDLAWPTTEVENER